MQSLSSSSSLSNVRTAARVSSVQWPSPSNIDIFVRNLYLLDLHTLPDWPSISARSFSPSQQNLRQRIKAVEWSLYHLLSIWDPQETASKLNPFFPPGDQLQSSNLRAALFRVLSDIKKSGVLGRDIIMRKSMFDDCKGEKFEELLAVLSTAVLRMSLEKKRDKKLSAMAVPEEYTLPMLIALRASLQTHAKDGPRLHEISTRATKFLEEQEREFDVRLNSFTGKTLQRDDALYQETHDKLMKSWQGDQLWADTILEGGLSKSRNNRFWEDGSPEAWRLIKQDELESSSHQLEPDPTPLLSLEARVAEQRSRLQMWKDFRTSLSSERSRTQNFRPRNQSTHPVFQRHQELTVAGIARGTTEPTPMDTNEVPQQSEHAKLIEAMNAALLENQTKKIQRDSGNISPVEPRGRRSSAQLFLDRYCAVSPALSLRSQGHRSSSSLRPASSRKVSNSKDNSSLLSAQQMEYIQPPSPQSPAPISVPSPDPSINVHKPSIGGPDDALSTNTSSDEPHLSPELTTQMKNLSLTERTKQSMAAFFAERSSSASPATASTPQPQDGFLSADPFKSPVRGIGSNPQTPRSGRYFSGPSTPREELFEKEADYASVFKSRPKIALSPVRPPLPVFRDSHIEGVLSDNEGEEDGAAAASTRASLNPVASNWPKPIHYIRAHTPQILKACLTDR
ncbi:hypothetical protein AAP_01618 [Ascosphaera apis ARSEF 7405]|uniref:HAUS augmin-like complex subunit 6 N-terminal domain-containing protein n=1 Tax=Ascosphaera apis ARSEF 7405 TaxID=392613 RepID=A0A166P8X2_9EURO|nr:hypothetical protein AAP_01618 [Ascosphaera apis ARSEF 7405]